MFCPLRHWQRGTALTVPAAECNWASISRSIPAGNLGTLNAATEALQPGTLLRRDRSTLELWALAQGSWVLFGQGLCADPWLDGLTWLRWRNRMNCVCPSVVAPRCSAHSVCSTERPSRSTKHGPVLARLSKVPLCRPLVARACLGREVFFLLGAKHVLGTAKAHTYHT